MLWAILNKTLKQYPTKQRLFGHLAPISKTIQVRQTRHARHCWKSKDKVISDVLLWTPTHGHANVGQPAKTYLYQLCVDPGCSFKELLGGGAMDGRDGWRQRESEKSVLSVQFDEIYIYI